MAKKRGRPSTYKPSKHPNQVYELMRQGFSIEACAGQMGVSKQTIYNWRDQYPELLDAIKRGESASQYFWEDLGISAITSGAKFNATVWIFNMKNRFGWRDRKDVEVINTESGEVCAKRQFLEKIIHMNNEELDKFIKKRQAKKL